MYSACCEVPKIVRQKYESGMGETEAWSRMHTAMHLPVNSPTIYIEIREVLN